ncbi:MAG: acetylornithine/succinylornithine family transaminase [Calditrichaeota bacterium]|nr:MAG: aminotransferase class III-fold pyridoxal phosphate-dependent enzyme [Calditrichota bacterium]MBL1205631.1 acetylornithine/succinylornithine family transaminase [Calditrichota bacterium]NOG45459.1 acetylornithine/succinylornithine family transaminase [Calditrichota bacterium]
MIDYNEIEKRNSVFLFNKRDLVLVKGKNAKVWDIDGNEYIDCTTGQGVASIGHANDDVVKAISEQAENLMTCSGSFSNDKRALFIQKLIEITPNNLMQVFLCNSGTESVEAALKFARYSTKKTSFICAMRNFHGRTFGALSATFTPAYKKDFEPIVPGFDFVPYNNFEKLKDKINDQTAAILLEAVQGEGGVNLGQKEYFRRVRQLCDEKNILLIIDEVQTGFCRTGRMFAFEHFDIKPDMICLAKAIAGGMPMGAVVCSDKIEMQPGKHGTTFGGNPLACAAGLAAIEFMQKENLAKEAEEKGRYIVEKLSKNKSDKIREIRQIGLMIGIELKEKVQPFISGLQKKGVLALPAGPTVLRLLPPLTISYEELDFVIEKVGKVF